ncbi:MAG: 4Fe-4S dicluster domain-containing protein [Syntrophobacterales bacterium]|nr:4Fe-4S dicluster domain-containing protein [Syntrophobacterales bacterium]
MREDLNFLRDYVMQLFEKEMIKAFVGYRREGGHLIPAIFRTIGELDFMELDHDEVCNVERYPIGDICRRLLDSWPEGKLGVMVRGCDERALFEMSKWNQVDLDRLVLVGIACSGEWIKKCGCKKPYPDNLIVGKPVVDFTYSNTLGAYLESLSIEERKVFWDEAFIRCIKCYGCRNICPVCFCRDCSLEDPLLVKPGQTPAEFPIFHLVRALHMAGRCIDCGLCEETCPAHIPLRTLYRKINAIMEEELGYQTGVKDNEVCPLNKV